MRPSASGFGFGGTAGCAGMPVEGRGKAAQSVRSDGDRSFGFWPRTTSRGSACAGESAQAVASLRDLVFEEAEAVAVTVRPPRFELSGTTDCAGEPLEGRGEAAQAVVSSRLSASDLFFGSLLSSGSSSVPSCESRTFKACAGESAQAVVSRRDVALEDVEKAVLLGDGDFEEVETAASASSSSFSASSSDSSSASASSSGSSQLSDVTLTACAGGAAQKVASLGDFIFGETEQGVASLR